MVRAAVIATMEGVVNLDTSAHPYLPGIRAEDLKMGVYDTLSFTAFIALFLGPRQGQISCPNRVWFRLRYLDNSCR